MLDDRSFFWGEKSSCCWNIWNAFQDVLRLRNSIWKSETNGVLKLGRRAFWTRRRDIFKVLSRGSKFVRPQLQEQTTLDMLLAQLLVLSRRSTMADTYDTTRSTIFQIVFHIYYYWLISWYYSTIIHQWIGFWWHGQNNQNMTAARRDSSSFSCGVLSDFCSALGLLHDAGLSAKRGASSSNCTATWMTWRVGTNGTRKWVIVYWCLLWTPPFLGVFWQVHDSHACTLDGCRVDCFFPLLLWLLAATTCGLTRTLLMDKLLFAVEFLWIWFKGGFKYCNKERSWLLGCIMNHNDDDNDN